MRLNRALGIAIVIGLSTALACGDGRTAVSVPPVESQSPSPALTSAPSQTTVPTNSPMQTGQSCGSDEQNMTQALMKCGDIALQQKAARLPRLVYYFDPKVPLNVQEYVQNIGSTYLPMYSGFFDDISDQAQIHVVLSLTPKWCGKTLLNTDDGTEEFLRENYCNQDGGANGGHGTMRFAEFGSIILRPLPSEVEGIKGGSTKSRMLNEIFVGELGHAARDVGADAMSGERGIAKWIPVWLQYVPNMFASLVTGITEKTGVSDVELATWGQRDLAWRPTVGDKRFLPWNLSGGGAYQPMDRPSLYNVAYLAGRYLVPKHGLEAITRDLMGTLIRTDGNYDKAASRLGYANWAELEAAVDESILAFYKEEGIEVPK